MSEQTFSTSVSFNKNTFAGLQRQYLISLKLNHDKKRHCASLRSETNWTLSISADHCLNTTAGITGNNRAESHKFKNWNALLCNIYSFFIYLYLISALRYASVTALHYRGISVVLANHENYRAILSRELVCILLPMAKSA